MGVACGAWPVLFDRLSSWLGLVSVSVFRQPFSFLRPSRLISSLSLLSRSRPTPEKRRAAFDVAAGGVLLTGFFFYIVTSTLILEAFDCQNFDDGSSYLKADFRISCDSDKYTFIYVSNTPDGLGVALLPWSVDRSRGDGLFWVLSCSNSFLRPGKLLRAHDARSVRA